MKYEFIGRNGFEPTQAIKDYVEKRLVKVVALFDEGIIKEVLVVGKVYPAYHKIEITIPVHGTVIRAESSDNDMYAAIDKVSDKLVVQIRKNRDKLRSKMERQGVGQIFSQDFDIEAMEKEVLATQLVKNKKIILSPMTTEDAIVAMELSGHDFFVYLDSKTSKTNVVYRREDGDYAVIETKPI